MTSTAAEVRAPDPAGAPAIVMEAIVKQMALAAVYNREDVTLAPHVLYTRHGDLHVDAVTLERGGRPPREVKIGTFRLTGLGGLRLTPRRFDASPLFQPSEERYSGTILLAVEGR